MGLRSRTRQFLFSLIDPFCDTVLSLEVSSVRLGGIVVFCHWEKRLSMKTNVIIEWVLDSWNVAYLDVKSETLTGF